MEGGEGPNWGHFGFSIIVGLYISYVYWDCLNVASSKTSWWPSWRTAELFSFMVIGLLAIFGHIPLVSPNNHADCFLSDECYRRNIMHILLGAFFVVFCLWSLYFHILRRSNPPTLDVVISDHNQDGQLEDEVWAQDCCGSQRGLPAPHSRTWAKLGLGAGGAVGTDFAGPLMFILAGWFMTTHLAGGADAMMSMPGMTMTQYDSAQNVLHGVSGWLMIAGGFARWRMDYDPAFLRLYCLLVNTFSMVWTGSSPAVLHPLVDQRLDGYLVAFTFVVIGSAMSLLQTVALDLLHRKRLGPALKTLADCAQQIQTCLRRSTHQCQTTCTRCCGWNVTTTYSAELQPHVLNSASASNV
jgi:hypothetical protein